MLISRPVQVLQRMVASVSILALLSSSMVGQTSVPTCVAAGLAAGNAQTNTPATPQGQAEYSAPLRQYTQPHSIWSIWKPYAPHGLPQPVLRNSDRLHSLLKDGKLMLSLNDAVALALENNFDIAIARYNLDIANTDVLLAKSGGTVRGVATGLLTRHSGRQSGGDQHGGRDRQRIGRNLERNRWLGLGLGRHRAVNAELGGLAHRFL